MKKPKTKEEMPFRYRRGRCKFCGAKRPPYKSSCLECKDKLPKYPIKENYMKKGYAQALADVEKIINSEYEFHKRYSKSTTESKMRFDDILQRIQALKEQSK